jgi:hypothetical protein
MKLSPVVHRYFEAWIHRNTWDSYHSQDNEKFYRFIKAIARYSRRVPSPADIYTLIVERWKGQRDSAKLDETAERFADLYQTLMDYEKTGGFPDPLIERTDIVKYHLELSVHSRDNRQHVNMTMTDVWGKDWRTKLDKAMREY